MSRATNFYTIPIIEGEAVKPAVAAFNTAPSSTLIINRLWARYLVSWMSQIGTNEEFWRDADADSARQLVLTHLYNFILAL